MKYISSKLSCEEIICSKEENIEEKLQEVYLQAFYEGGEAKSYKVNWNEEERNQLAQAKGTMTLHGQVCFPEYEDVLVEERADPCVLLAEDGYYYFTASYPVRGTIENDAKIGYDRIILRRARTIQELKTATEVTIWHQKDSNRLNRYIWAPELHKIGDSYYVIFTGSVDPDNVWMIRPHMLKCVGENLMDPKSWYTADESNLYQMTGADEFLSFSNFSLDMTCFEHRGRWYVIWAEIGQNQMSDLFLAQIDPDKPWELISKPMLLTAPEYEWEMRGGVKVNEGPFVLKHKDKIFVTFSASATDYTYCIGMLQIEEDKELLDIKNWKKYDKPFLKSEDFDDQCGPGHNSFTKDENGNDVLIYHARPFACSNAQDADGNYGRCEYVEPGQNPLSDPCRHARAKSIGYDSNGIPVLSMTAEEELPKACREVEICVTIM